MEKTFEDLQFSIDLFENYKLTVFAKDREEKMEERWVMNHLTMDEAMELYHWLSEFFDH